MSDIAALVADNLDIWTGAIEHKNGTGRGGGGKRINLYGIERLRALIYDLAATGKLIAGPTLQAEKLGKHVDLVMGQAPPGNACNTNGDGTIFVKTGEFGPRYPEIREWTKKPLKLAKSGDVLICVVGATIGKLNLAIDCAIGRSVAAIRPKPSLDTNYLYYALMPFTLRLRVGARGSAQGVIGKAELNAVSIRVPPLAEQRRIVAKVDELMALCDALERESAEALAAHQTLVETLLATLVNSTDATDLASNWARLETHFDTLFTTEASIDTLKQTVLELAVRGKLVEQYAADEPAIRKPKGQQVSPPFAIPANWQCVPLQAMGRQVGGGTPSKARPDFWDGPIPWVSPKDMKRDYLATAELSVSEAALEGSAVKLIAAQSLMFVVRGMILAHSFPVAIAKASVTINQDMKAIELDQPEMAEYLLRALKGLKPLMLARVERSSHGTCRLDAAAYGSFPIPVPPLAEQQRIVAKVDELMVLCDALKARLADAAETQKHLADAIVERAAA